MARRKARKTNKIEPAVMTMTFATLATGAGVLQRNYIDLSQVASLLNRRFYRQGLNWAVAGFKLISLQPGAVVVSKLPNTWVMANSWEKSFRTWQRMNNESIAEAESVRPRFLDFKIYADQHHHALGFGANKLPVSVEAAAFATPGEWEPSKFVMPNAPGGAVFSREAIAVGANYPGPGASGFDAVSLIEGYAASRGLPEIADPNTPDDAADATGVTPANWLSTIFNEGTNQDDVVLEDMITENNQAPYPFENDGVHTDTMYPGGANQLSGLEWHDSLQILSPSGIAGQGVGTQRAKGGNFPCGLVRIDWTPDETTANLIIQVDLVPGPHRGYLCEPMTEM